MPATDGVTLLNAANTPIKNGDDTITGVYTFSGQDNQPRLTNQNVVGTWTLQVGEVYGSGTTASASGHTHTFNVTSKAKTASAYYWGAHARYDAPCLNEPTGITAYIEENYGVGVNIADVGFAASLMQIRGVLLLVSPNSTGAIDLAGYVVAEGA
jgi:hypothetical protein